jgi:hypothetical protein
MLTKLIFGSSGPSPKHFSVANLSLLSLFFLLFVAAIMLAILLWEKDKAAQRKKLQREGCPSSK